MDNNKNDPHSPQENSTTSENTCQQQLQEYEHSIQALQKELEKAHEQVHYFSADLQNLRRRSEKDYEQALENKQRALLIDILDIADNFERAFADRAQSPEREPSLMGFELIYKSLKNLLAKYHVTEIPDTPNFDPEIHEAIMHVDDSTKSSGQIVTTLQKGYRYKDTVLRPAKVSVKP